MKQCGRARPCRGTETWRCWNSFTKKQNFGASYMWMAVGHYQSHFSQSSEHQGFRPDSWEASWVQSGSRRDPTIPGNQCRSLSGFQKEKAKIGSGWYTSQRAREKICGGAPCGFDPICVVRKLSLSPLPGSRRRLTKKPQRAQTPANQVRKTGR